MAPTTTGLTSRKILDSTGTGAKAVTIPKGQAVFTQGDEAGAVFFIQEGKVKLTIESKFGKKAALGIFSEGEFFGEDGMAEQPLRSASATAISVCRLLRINEKAMMVALQSESALSDLFTMQLLMRNIRYQETLVDQIFDPGEIRLARVLLLLALFGREGAAESVIPAVNEESLASMAGMNRTQVSSHMKMFSESGFLTFSKSGLRVHSSLLGFVLRG